MTASARSSWGGAAGLVGVSMHGASAAPGRALTSGGVAGGLACPGRSTVSIKRPGGGGPGGGRGTRATRHASW
eukprot:8687716-Alexandrium_andersonii.AAC.1